MIGMLHIDAGPQHHPLSFAAQDPGTGTAQERREHSRFSGEAVHAVDGVKEADHQQQGEDCRGKDSHPHVPCEGEHGAADVALDCQVLWVHIAVGSHDLEIGEIIADVLHRA